MRLLLEYCPDACWKLHYGKFGDGIRDLGDYWIMLFKFNLVIWTKKPYYNKRYKKNVIDTKVIF